MKIGIFDSGKGGRYVGERLRNLLPEHIFIIVDDHENVPYGNKSPEEIQHLTNLALQPLLTECPIIVIACNTATAHAISWLRNTYPETIFVGYEPMIKPAAQISRTNHVTILATPATRQSERYQQLKDFYGPSLIIDEPDTTDWATKIEADHVDEIALNSIEASLISGSDTVALACTHYLALQDTIAARFPGINVIEPTPAVARRITTLLGQHSPTARAQ